MADTGCQIKRLEKLLLRGPRRRGYANDLWTLGRVTEVIQQHFGVIYDLSGMWHLLGRMGWSCQKPEKRARERDEAAIQQWTQKDWPRIKKARRSRKTIVFVDESGFMLQPTVRRTWSPKGQTPIHYSWDRRDRLSVISAVSLSPKRRRWGLFFTVHQQNITADLAEPFVADLLEYFPKGLILV